MRDNREPRTGRPSACVQVLAADWPVPPNVHAVTTTRHGGSSAPPFESLNLGDHVGDDPQAVEMNRRRLRNELHLPGDPLWLSQCHGDGVFNANGDGGNRMLLEDTQFDASYTSRPAVVLAVLTADCLPVFFCDESGTEIAIAHAGWRGLAAGVLEATLASFRCRPDTCLAWFGPAIGPAAFEVGTEVREAFVESDPSATRAFVANTRQRWHADIFALARQRLRAAGVAKIFGGGVCTYDNEQDYFSHRRDDGACGRMASLIWRTA